MEHKLDNVMVSVVIPFYQNEKGLLLRCVNSILTQRGFSNYLIVIADDESPISPEEELADILQQTDKIKIVKQKNAGPGAARNLALDNIADDTKYVALMDSDDWWESDFLLNALTALEQGNELFFSNTVRDEIPDTRFDWRKSENLNLKPEEHKVLDQDKQLYTYQGDFFSYALVRSNILATSSTIYRLSCYPNLRFNVNLFNGQDRLFKLALCQVIGNVAFCPRVLVHECRGLNIYDSAKWGTGQSLVLLTNYIKLSKAILSELELSNKHQKLIIKLLNDCRYTLIANILHLTKIGEKVNWKLVFATFKSDPATLLLAPLNVNKVLFNKLTGK